jgi:hypothetical protein
LISVRCFDSFEQAAFLQDEVDALNWQSSRPDPFSTFEFYKTFCLHDEQALPGQGLRLCFLAAFSGDNLVGYLALRRVTLRVWGMRVNTLEMLVTHDNDRPHVVARPEHLGATSEAFYSHLLARPGEWSMLEFRQQDGSSALFPPPAAVGLANYRVREWPSLENCTIPVRWASLAAYFEALPKKYRTNLGRQMRHLLAAGQVELLNSSDPGVTPALLELCLAIEARSWKVQAQANIGRHPERVAYFRRLLEPGQPMRVSIQILLLDGMPVAGLVSGSFGSGLYALHIVYDDRLNRFAPGSAMLLLGMRQAIDAGCGFFNLLSGFGYYKVRWLAEVTPTRIAQIYRKGSLLDWRRRLGDGFRRWFAPRRDAAAQQFNPSRRDVTGRDPASGVAEAIEAPHWSTEQRDRCAALIARVRAGQGEFLSSAQLAAAMPGGVRQRPSGG